MSQNITLGLVQMSMSAKPEENLQKAERMTREAAQKGANIVCLPELFSSPYFCASPQPNFEYAEPIPGNTSKFLSGLAAELGIWLFGGSIHEKTGDKYFNTTMVYGPNGEPLGIYRKTHVPHDESFFEQHFFALGDTGFRVFDCGDARVGTLICYDQWYPEAARATALLGANVIFYPTAIGLLDDVVQEEGNWQEAWENVQRGHAIANGLIVAAVNRVGKEGRMTFWGGSFICDAFGKTIVRGGHDEEVIVAAVDLAHGTFVREGWRFFYNRRPDQYLSVTESGRLPGVVAKKA